jgi:hemoglobin
MSFVKQPTSGIFPDTKCGILPRKRQIRAGIYLSSLCLIAAIFALPARAADIDVQIFLRTNDEKAAEDARQKLEGAKAFVLLAVGGSEEEPVKDFAFYVIDVKLITDTLIRLIALPKSVPTPKPAAETSRPASRPVVSSPAARPEPRPTAVSAPPAPVPPPVTKPREEDREYRRPFVRANDSAYDTGVTMTTPLSRQEVDRRVTAMLRTAFREGANLYNTGQTTGGVFSETTRYPTRSAYYFQGTVRSIMPLLDHRPDLQGETGRLFQEALREKDIDERAWKVRGVMVHVWRNVSRMPIPPPPGPGETLWERLGEEAGVRAIVDDWIDHSIKDKRVNFFRDGRYNLSRKEIDQLKSHIVALASEIGRGPDYIKYRGRLLKKTHEKMGIREDELDAMISHLRLALIRAKITKEDQDTILGGIEFVRGDFIRRDIPPPGSGTAPKTVWDRMGGTPVVTKVVNDWIDSCVADRRHNFFREGPRKLTPEQITDLKQKLVQLASSLTKGTEDEYRGRNLTEAHRHLGITNEEFDAMISHLKLAMVKHHMKQPEMEFVLKGIEAAREKIVREKK